MSIGGRKGSILVNFASAKKLSFDLARHKSWTIILGVECYLGNRDLLGYDEMAEILFGHGSNVIKSNNINSYLFSTFVESEIEAKT